MIQQTKSEILKRLTKATLLMIYSCMIAIGNPGDALSQTNSKSTAVAVAIAHAEAWSNHNWEKATEMLAPNVHITASTTQQMMAPTELIGVDNYMTGLKHFAEAVEPGSLHIISSVGDKHNSLILLSVKAAFGPGGTMVTLFSSRLALFDENNKIISEQVIFFTTSDK
jgi:hypothetical protein